MMYVSYMKNWSPSGTVYDQRITMSQEEFKELNRLLTKDYNKLKKDVKGKVIIPDAELRELVYGKPLSQAEREGNTYYLTLTQLGGIMRVLPDNFWFGKRINKKLKNRNTMIVVKGK